MEKLHASNPMSNAVRHGGIPKRGVPRRGAVLSAKTGTLSEVPAGGGTTPGLGRTACSLVPGLPTIPRLRRSDVVYYP